MVLRALEPGTHTLEGFSVVAAEVPHKGGRTFGYRVSDGHSSLAYISDHCPTTFGAGPDGLGAYHPAALALARDTDLLIHDAQYTDDELAAKAEYGHAACGYAVGLASRARANRVLLFHHDPTRTDYEIDAIVALYKGVETPEVVAAADGMVIDLPAQ